MANMSVVVGELEALGFDEVEPGLIEDTGENKRALMRLPGAWSWERIRTEEGEYTGLIRPLDEEALTRRRESFHLARRPILENPADPWSDYKHPSDWPLDVDLPWWIADRLRRWRELDAEGVPEAERKPFPIRCTQLRIDNTRCWNWAPDPLDMTRCKKHVGYTKQAVRESAGYARDQVLEASPYAADSLIDLMLNASGEAVRLKASTEILDRAGVRGGVEIDVNAQVTQVDPGTALHDRLQKLAKRQAEQITEEPELSPPKALTGPEIVEAELVPDPEETP